MAPEDRTDRPAGTVTFLLAEVEAAATGVHAPDRVIDAAVAAQHGFRLDRLGEREGAVAVFTSAADAVAAAQDVQRALMAGTDPGGAGARLRMGIHTGEADPSQPHAYGGPALGPGARLRAVAH
ncbi:MAG: hypothetical protein ACRD0W_15125, partial [Acidimicrobiales bacterium]